jgi:hypothetical protein
MPECGDPKRFQVVSREAGQDPFVDLVLAEGGLISFEAQAPQPHCHIHDSALARWLRWIVTRGKYLSTEWLRPAGPGTT